MAPELDLRADPVELTARMVDIPSESGDEATIAAAVQEALLAQAPWLRVWRSGNAVLARTELGRGHRVLLAGHLDTVPAADNLPSRRQAGAVYGCGASDMKSGNAMLLHLAASIERPRHDLTLVLYDCEEIAAEHNGLRRIQAEHPEALRTDLAVLAEPTDGIVEAGCQGTLRFQLTVTGKRAHSARAWLGVNAIHGASQILDTLAGHHPRQVDIDGCHYREGLQAVDVRGGVAGNVVPDSCIVTVNFRFAPDRSIEQAKRYVRELFAPYEPEFTDVSGSALPGLSAPLAQQFLSSTGAPPRAKYGWTDVARFAELGIPAINFGPGDPNQAHTRNEHVSERTVLTATDVLRQFLTGRAEPIRAH